MRRHLLLPPLPSPRAASFSFPPYPASPLLPCPAIPHRRLLPRASTLAAPPSLPLPRASTPAAPPVLHRAATPSAPPVLPHASSAAVSASDLDLAFQLQLAEAVQASLRAHNNTPNNPHPSSSSSSQAAAPALPESSDASYALALHAADLSRAEEARRDAQACRAAHARAAASLRVAAHDALFARELAAIPEDRWAHDGDYFERPLDSHPLFRVFFKGMAIKVVVAPVSRLTRFDNRWGRIGSRVLGAFVPEGFPGSVTPDYVPFQMWDTLQGLSTYIRAMLSTQALLGAIGVGEKSATVIGATIQLT